MAGRRVLGAPRKIRFGGDLVEVADGAATRIQVVEEIFERVQRTAAQIVRVPTPKVVEVLERVQKRSMDQIKIMKEIVDVPQEHDTLRRSLPKCASGSEKLTES